MLRTSISFFAICLLLLSLVNYSCTKIDNTSIGADLLPAVDNVNTFDTTIQITANNFDSVQSDCAKIYPADTHVLGYISNDPYFGTTVASIYAELKPGSYPYTLPASVANIKLDSAVLVLSYTQLYGDSALPQKVNVYQVNTPGFKFDSSSCTTQTYSPLLIGSATYSPQSLKDSVHGFKENSSKQLRIKLDNAFAQTILSQDTTTGFKSDSLFKEFFKGFAIVPDISFGGNALTYYSLVDTNTKLAFYFKYPVNSVDTTVVTNFRLTTASATANNIVRDHAGAEITQHITHPEAGDDAIYIQTTPGSYAELKIPGLTTLSNRIVHRAELTMEQVYSPASLDGYFTPPGLLYLDYKYSDTTRRPIPCDFNVSSGQPNFSTLGGYVSTGHDLAGNTISKYTFDISRYVQKIITNRTTNNILRLSAPDYIINTLGFLDDCGQTVSPFNYFVNYVTFGRVKLGGGNNVNYPMRLRIIYSKI